MPALQATVQTYRINGCFLPGLGRDKEAQDRLSDHIGDLPEKIEKSTVGAYEVHVANDLITVYIVPIITPGEALDTHVSLFLETMWRAGKLQLNTVLSANNLTKIGFEDIIKKKSLASENVSKRGRINRLQLELNAAQLHFIRRSQETGNVEERKDCEVLVSVCAAGIVSTLGR